MQRYSRDRGRLHRLDRAGFTIVELLVVLAIMLLLTAITLVSVNLSYSADRVRSGARQMQSFLLGARDKAIYAGEIRGVRLLLDPNDPHAVSAFQFIGAPQRETGTLSFVQTDLTGRTVKLLSGVQWGSLYRRGLLRPGAHIRIPADVGPQYTISSVNSLNNELLISQIDHDVSRSTAAFTFSLELAATALGNAEPVELPRGVVIDLDGSQLPRNWRPFSESGPYGGAAQMDILFSPRGVVIGEGASLGMLHFHIADATDVLKWKQLSGRSQGSYSPISLPIVPANNLTGPAIVNRDRILVSVTTRTGSASVHYVNATNSAGLSYADDPYFYAETGQVANK